jgi:hypothetical protein
LLQFCACAAFQAVYSSLSFCSLRLALVAACQVLAVAPPLPPVEVTPAEPELLPPALPPVLALPPLVALPPVVAVPPAELPPVFAPPGATLPPVAFAPPLIVLVPPVVPPVVAPFMPPLLSAPPLFAVPPVPFAGVPPVVLGFSLPLLLLQAARTSTKRGTHVRS